MVILVDALYIQRCPVIHSRPRSSTRLADPSTETRRVASAARAKLDEEDATWRRRLNLGEDRSKDEDDDETGGSRGGIEDGCGGVS